MAVAVKKPYIFDDTHALVLKASQWSFSLFERNQDKQTEQWKTTPSISTAIMELYLVIYDKYNQQNWNRI